MRMDLMKGVIDMHVHTNPDLRLRAYDDFELMEAAIRVGARAIVIKTHQGSTVTGHISVTATTRSYMGRRTTSRCSAGSR